MRCCTTIAMLFYSPTFYERGYSSTRLARKIRTGVNSCRLNWTQRDKTSHYHHYSVIISRYHSPFSGTISVEDGNVMVRPYASIIRCSTLHIFTIYSKEVFSSKRKRIASASTPLKTRVPAMLKCAFHCNGLKIERVGALQKSTTRGIAE